jgi:glutamate-ammonia-ligase adenylyltransferase
MEKARVDPAEVQAERDAVTALWNRVFAVAG